MNTISFLILDDGKIFKGRAFGAPAPTVDELSRDGDRASGEVVFNTGMSGYPEIATDPSYLGQLVVMTSPHIGNYGVDESWSEYGTGKEDSKQITGLSGLIVRSLYTGLIPGKRMSLDFFLKKNNTPGITDIDTRALTLKLRDEGSSNGLIVRSGKEEDILNIKSDSILVSNGPGAPAALKDIILQIKKNVGKIPLTGICLGHQLISLALGAETEKMKFGHHGINHPVRDENSGRIFITSQNHGFTVKENSFPKGMEVWMKNSNDGSIEGIKQEDLNILTTQFHPEAAPGPHDSLWVFDEFIKMTEMKSAKGMI